MKINISYTYPISMEWFCWGNLQETHDVLTPPQIHGLFLSIFPPSNPNNISYFWHQPEIKISPRRWLLHVYLVGGWALPLWKIWKSVGMSIPYRKIKNVPNHQSDIIQYGHWVLENNQNRVFYTTSRSRGVRKKIVASWLKWSVPIQITSRMFPFYFLG